MRTVDTDVVLILTSIVFQLIEAYTSFNLIIDFGVGKNFKHYPINDICSALGRDRCEALPFFHAFSGSDTTSQFFNLGKTTMWKAWKSFPEVTKSFSRTFHAPFEEITIESRRFQVIERFTYVAYNSMTTSCVNKLKHDMLTGKVPLMENLPPTEEALLQHTKRCHFQAFGQNVCKLFRMLHRQILMVGNCAMVSGYRARVT